jgi:DNA-binding PadR family transcriptional regulator
MTTRPTGTRPVNATAASLLGFLHDGPASGWDLLRIARLSIGRFWSITSSQVYRELAAMETDGLVVGAAAGPRERRAYRITAAGRRQFRAWTTEAPGDEQVRIPLLLLVSFGRHLPPGHLAAAIEEFAARHTTRRDEYEAALGSVDDPYLRATLTFGARYEQAVLAWCDDVATILPPTP